MQVRHIPENQSFYDFTTHLKLNRSDVNEKIALVRNLSSRVLSSYSTTSHLEKIKLKKSILELTASTERFSENVREIKVKKRKEGNEGEIWRIWLREFALDQRTIPELIMDELGSIEEKSRLVLSEAERSLSEAMKSKGSTSMIDIERFEEDLQFLFGLVDQVESPRPDQLVRMRAIGRCYPELLFEKNEDQQTFFAKLMAGDHANEWFDLLLPLMNDPKFLEDRTKLNEILDFGFSNKRYEAVFVQDRDLSLRIHEQLEETYVMCSRPELSSRLDSFRKFKGQSYELWMEQRMGSSDSLTGNYNTRDKFRQNWRMAEEYIRMSASQEGMDGIEIIEREKFNLSIFQEMHAIITEADPEIPNPGQTRDKLRKVVGIGGSTGLGGGICPPQYLGARLLDFETWMEDELCKCDRGEKNPILLAAQTYERMLTFHPFENGNGRAARLAMDYVLERYHLPPVILDKDVFDIAFSLKPAGGRDKEGFLLKIIQKLNRYNESSSFLI